MSKILTIGGITTLVIMFSLIFIPVKTLTVNVDTTLSDYNVYRVADYSEDEDSWEEPASVEWNIRFIDGRVVKYNCPDYAIMNGYCKTPSLQRVNDEKSYQFNRYEVREKWIKEVYLSNDNEYWKYSNFNHSDYNYLVLNLNKDIEVKINVYNYVIGIKRD